MDMKLKYFNIKKMKFCKKIKILQHKYWDFKTEIFLFLHGWLACLNLFVSSLLLSVWWIVGLVFWVFFFFLISQIPPEKNGLIPLCWFFMSCRRLIYFFDEETIYTHENVTEINKKSAYFVDSLKHKINIITY